MIRLCQACASEKHVTVYWIWPVHWYKQSGPWKYLCSSCAKEADTVYPPYVISPKECQERFQVFFEAKHRGEP